MIETTPLISFPYLLYDSYLSLLAVALVRYLLPLVIKKKKKITSPLAASMQDIFGRYQSYLPFFFITIC